MSGEDMADARWLYPPHTLLAGWVVGRTDGRSVCSCGLVYGPGAQPRGQRYLRLVLPWHAAHVAAVSDDEVTV